LAKWETGEVGKWRNGKMGKWRNGEMAIFNGEMRINLIVLPPAHFQGIKCNTFFCMRFKNNLYFLGISIKIATFFLKT
jgi:hypothetical protein